jgi:ribosomal protein L36
MLGLPLPLRSLLPRAPLLQGMTSRFFKVRSSVKVMCSACYVVKRKGKVFILCKSDAKVRARCVLQPERIARAPARADRPRDARSRLAADDPGAADPRHARPRPPALRLAAQHKQRQG